MSAVIMKAEDLQDDSVYLYDISMVASLLVASAWQTSKEEGNLLLQRSEFPVGDLLALVYECQCSGGILIYSDS